MNWAFATRENIDSDPTRQLVRRFRRTAISFRRYRVDATVLFCGIPIFSRKGVGGGYAAVEIGTSPLASSFALQFAAGSSPAQAAGLNRFGILREVVVEHGMATREFAFSGLITSSKEEDLSEAKNALHSNAPTAHVVFARGHSYSGALRTWVGASEISAVQTWADSKDLLDSLIRNKSDIEPKEIAIDDAITFLAAMREAASCPKPMFERSFVHSGKLYVLQTQRRSTSSRELNGVIRTSSGQKSAEFRTVYESDDKSGIPTRIEYRAKSFLRLVFEADSQVSKPEIEGLFEEEAI